MLTWFRRRRSPIRQALRVAAVVGPVLVIANSYDALMSGRLPPHFWSKAAVTVAMPFLVSLYTALGAEAHDANGPAGPGRSR